MSKASSLVAQAKQRATYYGKFTKGERGAVLSVPLRVGAAWENNDADALADVFIDNGSPLIRDEQLKGEPESRTYLAAQFEGPLKGSRITEEPMEIKTIAGDVACGDRARRDPVRGRVPVRPEREMRAMWGPGRSTASGTCSASRAARSGDER